MKAKHHFDMTEGTQEVFRLLLDALANPGRPVDLSGQASQFAAEGQWLAPALTLLDNDTGFYWNGNPETGAEIQFLSGGIPVPLEQADFVFISSNAAEAARILPLVKSGTHIAPHDSALLLIAASGTADTPLLLKGPGVPPDGRTLLVSATETAWIQARDAHGFEFPCGVEIVFLREDGSLVAVTRKAEAVWRM